MAWIFISLQWQLIEDTSYHPLTEGPLAWATALALPWACIGLTYSTSYARYSRGQMIETLGEDYVRTAEAKGASSAGSSCTTRCGRRSCRSSRSSASTSPFLLTGTVFTEQIFEIDGVGRWSIEAIFSPVDFPVVAATVLVAAVDHRAGQPGRRPPLRRHRPAGAAGMTALTIGTDGVRPCGPRQRDPYLVVENLTVQFPTHDGLVQAVSDLCYTVRSGQTLGIVGESGSGKSRVVDGGARPAQPAVHPAVRLDPGRRHRGDRRRQGHHARDCAATTSR